MGRSDYAVFLLLFATATALNVRFEETDIVVNEDDKILNAVVVMEHNTISNVTLQIIPRSLQQFLASGHTLPQDVNLATVDPAEEGLDFDASPHMIFLGTGDLQRQVVSISILDDNLTEREEVFLLELRVVRVDPPQDVSSVRNVTVVRIMPLAADQSVVRLVADKTQFYEGNGTIADALFLELTREIESNITVRLHQSTGSSLIDKDIILPDRFTIPSRTRKISVPFHIVDDNITKEDQIVTIRLQHTKQGLFRVDSLTAIEITIKDNDVARIGFTSKGMATNMLEMVEGETDVFCVTLLEPQSMEKYFKIPLSSSPDVKTTSIISNLTKPYVLLYPQNLASCLSVRTLDNDLMNDAQAIRYQINMTRDEMIVLDPPSLDIIIRDNDGPPMKPEIMALTEDNFNLHISWTLNVSKFKPVDKFIVSVTEDGKVSSVISRRQTKPFHEHETNETSYILPMSEHISYFIRVCASNRNHRNCSEEVTFSMKSDPVTNFASDSGGRDIFEAPPPLGLVNEEEQRDHGGLGKTSFIAVIVGPAVAFALSLILIVIVLLCKCWGERRHYYPSKQEKILMASNIEMKNYYYRQRSSTTSISNEWTLSSPNNYFISSQKDTKLQPHTLGTPV